MKLSLLTLRLSNRGRAWVVAAALGLVACSSPTEKANSFYAKGAELLQKGDLEKARIEFRNALQIKDDLTAAWYGMAQIAEKQGDAQSHFGLLNKVVERDPKHLEAQLKLGRMLLAGGQLDKALKVSDATLALAKDNTTVLALRSAVFFKLDDKKGAVELANAALSKDANNIDALVVLATERLTDGDANKAIEYLDRGLQINEKHVALQLIKVQALENMAQVESAEAIFRKLISFYPENRAFRHILARFYLSHNARDKAEAEFRAVVAESPADLQAKLDLVRFIASLKGIKAATQELQAFIAKEPGNNELLFALASLHQAQNNRQAAEEIFRSIMAKAGDSADGLKARGQLASSLLAAGDRKSAEVLVAEILAKDQRNEHGLILKAGLEVDDRKLEEAIADLRALLRDVPDSARALLLLGKAHELANAPELADEHYLKAFKASKMSASYGTAFAGFLLKRGQAARAEKVLEESLSLTPGYLPALKMLAQARINRGDWAGAQEVADVVRRRGDQGKVSEQILGAIYAGKKEYDHSISAFKRFHEAAPNELQPIVVLVRTYLLAGKTNEALSFISAVLKTNPANTSAQLLQGQLQAMKGDSAAATQSFQTVISREPKSTAGYLNLANLHLRERHFDEADKVVAQGLAAVPNDFGLRLTLAAVLELSGRIDEAIRLYEELIKLQPNADILANNLASLLTDHRSDKASLNRAFELAQRFKRSDIPQYKDTLGWANYRLGKHGEAASLLEDATKQLPDLPVFRYHLGMSYLALNNKDAARQELQKALSLSENNPFLEAEQVKQALKGL